MEIYEREEAERAARSVVYYIRSGDLVKIGVTVDLKVRHEPASRNTREHAWMLRLLTALGDYRDGNPGKGRVTELQHSLQTATRARNAHADDELVCVALLHDAAKPLTETAHGEAMAAVLDEYLTPDRAALLRHHSAYQDAAWSGRPFPRATAPWWTDALWLGTWDAASFDPGYPTLPLADFEPMLRRLYRVEG